MEKIGKEERYLTKKRKKWLKILLLPLFPLIRVLGRAIEESWKKQLGEKEWKNVNHEAEKETKHEKNNNSGRQF